MLKLLSGVIGAVLIVAPGPACAVWHQAKSKHFIIYADSDPGELRDYAVKIERFDQAVRLARTMSDPPLADSGRLTIYVFRNVGELARLTGGSSVYGIYRARASGSYAFVAKNDTKTRGDLNSDIIFFHEYAHHLMLQNSAAAYPAWLVEGFAEFLSTARMNDDGSVTLGVPADHRSGGIFALDHDLPLSAMVGGTYRGLTGWQRELIYARGWLLTHYLTFEKSRKGQLDRYVAGIQAGQKATDSAKAAFGDLRQLDRELDRYAKQKTISGIVVNPDAAKIGQIDIRPLSPAEAAIMPVRIKSDFGVGGLYAGRNAAHARKIAADFPNDPAVQAALAEAEHDAEHYAAAAAAADRALAAQPRSAQALIYKGRALLKLAKDNPAGADWVGIRQWFARANRLDPEDPEPLMLFYRTFLVAGAKPTENASKGLLYALALAPQDELLRLTAVRQLLVDGKLAEARRQFAALAFDPHAGSFQETADEIVAAIDASDGSKALALIDAWKRKHEID